MSIYAGRVAPWEGIQFIRALRHRAQSVQRVSGLRSKTVVSTMVATEVLRGERNQPVAEVLLGEQRQPAAATAVPASACRQDRASAQALRSTTTINGDPLIEREGRYQ